MERPDFKADFVYTVDFRPVKHYRDLYKCIKNGLDLPDFFGENRDALWDCLTGFIRCPCDIRFSGISSSGLVAVEAMGCGRPVLATRSGGMPEYLDGSQAVLVDRDGNVAGQLSFAIRMLYEHPDLRAQMSTAGAKTAQRYSSARFYDDFVRIVYDFGGHLWNSPSSV